MNPRVKKVEAKRDYTLLLTFSNNGTKVFDLKPYLNIGIFESLQDLEMFKTAKVFNGTVVWKNDLDFCPDTLYLESEAYNTLKGIEI